MVYHSSFTTLDESTQVACGCPLLPLRSTKGGGVASAPAAHPPVSETSGAQDAGGISGEAGSDIVDEAIYLFRCNVLFRKFPVNSPADKLLIYITLYINHALRKVDACGGGEADGLKALVNLGLESFSLPGDKDFPLLGLFSPPKSKEEADLLRSYWRSVREETSARLIEKLFVGDEGGGGSGSSSKWWLCFAKRKFMNIQTSSF